MEDDPRAEDLPDDLTPFITRTTLDHVSGGAFGDVWKCNYNADGISAVVAVKAFRFSERDGLETINRNIRREIGILKILRHNNIVPLWGIATGFGRMPGLRCLVSPWMPNGTLTTYLTSNHDNLTVLDRSRMLEDVSAGLRYLHSQSVMHGDITGANILIDKRGHARLIDFGLSTVVQPLLDQSHLAISSIRPGAIRYAAPELVLPNNAHEPPVPLEKADIYSFGCIMLQILSGRRPWREILGETFIIVAISQGRGPQRPDGHPGIIDLDWKFIQKCLQFGPELRPSAEEVLDFVMHRFYSSGFSRPGNDPPDDGQDGFPGAFPHEGSEGPGIAEHPPTSPPRPPKLKTVITDMSGLSLFSSGSSSPHGGVGVSTGQEAIDGHLVYAPLGTLPDRSTRQEEVIQAIREIIHEHLKDAPLRLLNTHSGILCSRDAQIKAFIESTEYEELLDSSVTHGPLQRPIEEAVMMYFRWVMLSHRWGMNEPMLRDIQHKDIYSLDPDGGTVKLQNFCKAARDAGYRWAWSDTCCIDKQSNYEVQKSVNSMFVWYYHSALTIVYLSDVPPLSKSGALAESAWNMRGWTIPELLAPKVILFYKADWTLYLDDRSYNHKESVAIMRELQHSTGINAQALVAFRPEMRDAREKLQWASRRTTTIQEDVAYSLFGVFGVHLPIIYGERKQNALGRLLQEIIARSGDISALDWVGKPSEFNSCLPADITSYSGPPCVLSPWEDEMQTSVSVSTLRSTVGVEVLKQYTLLYTRLENMHPPRFAHCRLHLPCITFPLTEISRRPGQDGARSFTYSVKADGLKDLLVTEARLSRFPSKSPVPLSFLLVRPWNRYGLGEDWDWSGAGSLSDNDSLSWSPGDLTPQVLRFMVKSKFSSRCLLELSSLAAKSINMRSYLEQGEASVSNVLLSRGHDKKLLRTPDA